MENKKIIKLDKDYLLKINHKFTNNNRFIAYGVIIDDDIINYVVFSNSTKFEFQWEISYIHDKLNETSTFEYIWDYFLKSEKVNSVFVESNYKNNIFEKIKGFKNISKFKEKESTIYIGEYNKVIYELNEDSINKIGLFKLIGYKQKDLYISQEQALIDELSFSKKIIKNFTSQKDFYFKFGKIYKITDLNTNEYYYGSTTNESAWDTYYGSGTKWKQHLKEKKNHKFLKEELKDIKDFKFPIDFYEYERESIEKHLNDPLCLNTNKQMNHAFLPENASTCSECGSKYNRHKKFCSKRKHNFIKNCNCGANYGEYHKKTCPVYKDGKCPECGYSLQSRRHAITCSKYKEPKVAACCPECHTRYGHKANCSRGAGIYECCGNSKQSKHHAKWCVNYDGKENPLLVCLECKGINDNHSPNCSHNGKCNICNTKLGRGSRHKQKCEFNILLNIIKYIKNEKITDIKYINDYIKTQGLNITLTKSDLLMYGIGVNNAN